MFTSAGAEAHDDAKYHAATGSFHDEEAKTQLSDPPEFVYIRVRTRRTYARRGKARGVRRLYLPDSNLIWQLGGVKDFLRTE